MGRQGREKNSENTGIYIALMEQKPRKILITTYHFTPEINARAFRTFELAREFARSGHKVVVYIPEYDFDFSGIVKKYGFDVKTVKTGFFLNRDSKKTRKISGEDKDPRDHMAVIRRFLRKTVISFIRRWIIEPFLCNHDLEYALTLRDSLLKDGGSYDLLISIGLPFGVHLGSALAFGKNKALCARKVADYGDPYSFNKTLRILPYHKYIEKYVLEKYDFITVPVAEAVSSYTFFKPEKNIRVIPQGIDLDSVRTREYTENTVPVFAYSGMFYRGARDPAGFMEYLRSLDRDFRFIVYTNKKDLFTMSCLGPFTKSLSGRLFIKPLLPREECIRELSKCDFLINIMNRTSNQRPSKLIDYGLAGRPVYSFKTDDFDPAVFEEFLNRDYSKSLKIDVFEYDIRKIAEKFLDLTRE